MCVSVRDLAKKGFQGTTRFSSFTVTRGLEQSLIGKFRQVQTEMPST